MTSKKLSQPEFIALIAMMIASAAFAVDSMLPALTEISATLTPDNPNRAQLIITSFVFGMGIGTLFSGPLSDTFGRKPVILAGMTLYVAGALLCYFAPTLELLLAARVIQGLGASAPRVAALALVRDTYEGRRMAQIMSFAMMVFTLIPAIAPLTGQMIIAVADWRAIFLGYVAFAGVVALWLGLRQPETLIPENRRDLRPRDLAAGVREILGNRLVSLTIGAQAFVFAVMFTLISTAEPIFVQVFDRGDTFPYWFGMLALLSAGGSFLNTRLVMRFGMRRIAMTAMAVQCVMSFTMTAIILTGALTGNAYFAAFIVWMLSIFLMGGLCIGNLNALAMEPLGRMAGLGASVIGALATIGAVIIAVPIGQAFNGTPLAPAMGALICYAMGLSLLSRQGTEPSGAEPIPAEITPAE
ncbi:multidrug effflux MFS transporter [Pseudoruegeria sp. HB172150]|uniref:multidrug effflux MFS transporter n=1 Tax=Pseudoruegeria sp. HB172150 TaxID=2721164 RepID=UPI00155293CF|nr:multidrug effflux MFS transporter [Pseudoruegeria sp. HB172150]